jgi:hypothetical protein
MTTEIAPDELTAFSANYGEACEKFLAPEQWLQLHPETPAPKAAAIKQALRDYFNVDADA